jgi:hypothetical protein
MSKTFKAGQLAFFIKPFPKFQTLEKLVSETLEKVFFINLTDSSKSVRLKDNTVNSLH